MGKISPVSAKYIVHASIDIEGVVDRPDVIGAIFGQTEGLLGADLELRELQRSGRIGRIEVNVDTRSGKTSGEIIIPSSLDKAETSIVGAALEIINRIGPCNSKIEVKNIEDVRVSKRNFVVKRAKTLLKSLMDDVMPDSQELSDEVAQSVRVMEITEYGKDRLPAGPGVKDADEIILVEGRADVLNLLKHGFKNAIAMNGTNVPETIKELSKKKTITAFVDGDRGGDLILKSLFDCAEIDFVAKAPDGKEVEEITKKEIHKSIRSKIAAEQVKLEKTPTKLDEHKPFRKEQAKRFDRSAPKKFEPIRKAGNRLSEKEKNVFKELLDESIGTRGAHVLDKNLNVLGKVPISELVTTLNSLKTGVYAVVLDGNTDKSLVDNAERSNVSYIISRDNSLKGIKTRVEILTGDQL